MKKELFSSHTYFNQIAQLSKELVMCKEYTRAVDLFMACYAQNGTVFTMGCGGSASTATHFAADLAKTTGGGGKPGFRAISLVDNIPLVSAWTNDRGWGSVFAGQLEQWITPKDILVGFSVHGGTSQGDTAGPWSQNIVAALKFAKKKKATIIGFAGFDGGAMKKLSDTAIVIPTHSEIYGTHLVEALHVVLHHAIIGDLKEKIRKLK